MTILPTNLLITNLLIFPHFVLVAIQCIQFYNFVLKFLIMLFGWLSLAEACTVDNLFKPMHLNWMLIWLKERM